MTRVDPSSFMHHGPSVPADSHLVQRGETLSQIAGQHGTTVEALLAANPQIRDADHIVAGDRLALPAPGDGAAPAPAFEDHVVRQGETLWQLARDSHTSVSALARLNGLTRPDRLQIGQHLRLPHADALVRQLPHERPAAPAIPAPATDRRAPAAGSAAPILAAPAGAQADHLRGELSSRYETGGRGPGTVSRGVGDAGGVSYGSYQLATNRGRPAEFLAAEGSRWAPQFAGQTPGSADFSATWRRIAQAEPEAFQAAQHRYIERTHYDVTAEGVQRRTGLDIETRSATLQDVVWSTSVQHGPATRVVDHAVQAVDARMRRDDPGYDSALIQAIYGERGRRDTDGALHHFRSNSARVQEGVAERFVAEQADAQRMLARELR